MRPGPAPPRHRGALQKFKTHSARSFADLLAKGVRDAKPMHWAQVQVYVGLTGMDRALYLTENKDTSALYQERIEADPVAFAESLARAERIIPAAEPPPRISAGPAWYQCKPCGFHDLCHTAGAQAQAPEVNCRTCAHSTPELDGDARWSCALHKRDLSFGEQMAGCDGHRHIPILLERIGEQTGAAGEPDGNAAVTYRTPAGETFVNGAPPNFASREIHASKHKGALGSPQVQAVKQASQVQQLRAPSARLCVARVSTDQALVAAGPPFPESLCSGTPVYVV